MAVTRHLPKRLPLVPTAVAASFLIALICAVCSISSVSLLPPKIASRDVEIAGATTSVLIDAPKSVITEERPSWAYDIHSLISRAALFARLMATAPGVQYIARDAGFPPSQIAAVAPVTVSEPSELVDAGSERRARELLLAGDRYRLEIQSRPDSPVIDIYAQGPSPAAADRLANAAIAGLRDYLRVLAVDEGVNPTSQVRIDQLGPAHGGVINSGAREKIAGLTFSFAFVLSLVFLLALGRRLSRQRRPAPVDADPPARPRVGVRPVAAMTMSAAGRLRPLGLPGPLAASTSAGAVALPQWRLELPVRSITGRLGDWPRTTRVLPWLLAAFMAILWLVPFDSIALRISLPIDLKFDRLVLPIVWVTWLLAVMKGGVNRPRIRISRIHIAVGIFVGLAFLSVVINAASLNQTLELDTSIKQLPLLVSYLSVFFMVASVVRHSEVRGFLTYTLVLATICALGMIVEYKTRYNVFFDLSSKLLPSNIFSVAVSNSGYDSSGRLLTHGPTAHGLAAASMLSMALAIAIVRIIHAERPRARILYTLVAGTLMVAVFATQKKTGLIAPAAAVLALGCFRRRELLKMAPVALLLLIVVLIVSPGTVEPVIKQFSSSALGGNAPSTTSDREARYDAIRPDVWTHLALGRGYGSYQPLGHRIMDSEVLLRLIEMGVLGLAAFIWLGLSVVATARKAINSRDPSRAPPALAGVAAAAVFVVVGALFDSISFPQVPYIFLCLAAYVAVAVKPPDEHSPSWQ
jgi:hypothetical protein